jgi:hypothetical protein
MIPVDAQIWTEPDVRRDGFSLETVLGEINSRGAGVKIALIDASRRNPFERRFRSFSAGLAPVIAPNGTLVMYSAALSSVIGDNGGDHSLFVQELLKEIRVPDLMAEETLNRTRVGVTRASRSEQVPWISSSLAEDFSFIPGGGADASPPSPVARPQAARPFRPSGPRRRPCRRAAAARADEAPPPKPVEVNIPAPRRRPTAGREEDGRRRRAGRRPDHQEPDRQAQRQSRRCGALYRRGQVYASKGAYRPCHQGLQQSIG